MDKLNENEDKKLGKKELRDELFKLVANFDEVKPQKKEEPPTQVQLEAQAAIDDVQVIIPEGMTVRTHQLQDEKEMVQTNS